MAAGFKTGGRTAGTRNKLTATAKDTIAQCAELLERNGKTLFSWVDKDEKNEFAFWTSIYPKLLPLQLTGDAENPLAITEITRTIIKPK
jgi:hypothetical protein